MAQLKSMTKLALEYKEQSYCPIMLQTCILLQREGVTDAVIQRRCGVTPTTLRRWRQKRTRRSNATTLRFVLKSLGYKLVIAKAILLAVMIANANAQCYFPPPDAPNPTQCLTQDQELQEEQQLDAQKTLEQMQNQLLNMQTQMLQLQQNTLPLDDGE